MVNAVISPADGTLSPFTIPAGQVLVLTGGSWGGSGLAPGASAHLVVVLRTSTTANGLVFSPAVVANSAGYAAGSFVLEPGIVVKPGAALCTELEVNGTTFSSFLASTATSRRTSESHRDARRHPTAGAVRPPRVEPEPAVLVGHVLNVFVVVEFGPAGPKQTPAKHWAGAGVLHAKRLLGPAMPVGGGSGSSSLPWGASFKEI